MWTSHTETLVDEVDFAHCARPNWTLNRNGPNPGGRSAAVSTELRGLGPEGSARNLTFIPFASLVGTLRRIDCDCQSATGGLPERAATKTAASPAARESGWSCVSKTLRPKTIV